MKFNINYFFVSIVFLILLILIIKIFIADTGLRYAYEYLNSKIDDNYRLNERQINILSYKEEKKPIITKKNTIIGWKKKYSNFDFDKNIISERDLNESLSWIRSHGGNFSNKFSNLDQINSNNIYNLKLLWKFDSSKRFLLNKKWNNNVEINPIFYDGLIYVTTPYNEVLAINVLDGSLEWKFKSLKEINSRGIIFWQNKENIKNSCIFVPIRESIFCINYKTGKRIKSFGIDGYINSSTVRAAPLIWNNNLIVATLNPPQLKLYSLPQGILKWTLPLHPKDKNFTGGTPWGGISLDVDRNLAFLTTGNPRPALYGGTRLGNNHNANSIIAIDLIKKEIKWSFQEVSHDLWDYDIAAPPILTSIKINNEFVDVIIVVTKIGNTFILKRENGEPFFDINYRIAPESDVPGEVTSKYQISKNYPEPLIKFEFEKDDITKRTEEAYNYIYDQIENSKYGWFEPPSIKQPLILYGLHGGAQWTGGVVNPYNQNLFIPVNQVPWRIRLFYTSDSEHPINLEKEFNLYKNECSSCHGIKRQGKYETEDEKELSYIPSLIGIYNNKNYKFTNFKQKIIKYHENNFEIEDIEKIYYLFNLWDEKIFKEKLYKINYQWSQFLDHESYPASKPPWGKIISLNLITGKINWQVPHGYINDINIGTSTFGGLINTKGNLIFATGTEDNKIIALEEKSGKEIWSFEMDAAGSAPPTTFEFKDKQILIVVSSGGRYHNYKNKSGSIYAFAIKE